MKFKRQKNGKVSRPLSERIYLFFSGRNGFDVLNAFLIVCYFLFAILNLFVNRLWVWIIQALLFVLFWFRFFSKDKLKRAKENGTFCSALTRVRRYFLYRKNKWKYRKTYVYKKCFSCKNRIRFPRKKGKHTVKCPCCGNSFDVSIR